MRNILGILVLLLSITASYAQDINFTGNWETYEDGERSVMVFHKSGVVDVFSPDFKTDNGVLKEGEEEIHFTYSFTKDGDSYAFDLIAKSSEGELVFKTLGRAFITNTDVYLMYEL